MLAEVTWSVLYIENQWVERFKPLLRLAQIGPLVPRQYTKSVSKQTGPNADWKIQRSHFDKILVKEMRRSPIHSQCTDISKQPVCWFDEEWIQSVKA
jgi:hypothetical protein